MFPSSSAAPIADRSSKISSRHNSNAATPILGQDSERRSSKQERVSSRPGSPAVSLPASGKTAPHYTVFIRLPFPRESFEDPPAVEWDASKDQQLWKLISGSHVGKGDLDWEGLSHDFGVDLSFLLMQAAWLSERHMERMRKQVGRIAGVQGDAVSSAAGGILGGVKMERTGSRESKIAPVLSAASTRRESPSFPLSVEPGGSPGTSTPLTRATISRTPSSATVTQSKIFGSTMRQPASVQRALRGSSGSGRRPTPVTISTQGSPRDEYYEDAIEHEGPSDSDSEEEPSAMARSQAFRRPPIARKAKQTLGTLGSDDGDVEDDEDSGGGYLPFAATSKSGKSDPAATIRSSPKKQTTQPASAAKPKPIRENSATTATTESSNSSASSAMQQEAFSDVASGNEQSPQANRRSGRPPGALSSRHRAQLQSLSPRMHKEGSEGSPSMGSSFSDLDDASLTQSALEDALLSNMRQVGSSMASRMSSLRDALGRRS